MILNCRIGYSIPMFCGFIIMFVSTVSEYFSISADCTYNCSQLQ